VRASGDGVHHVSRDGADHRATPETRNELAQARTSLAEHRTLLASERSLLAWYRTAFGAYALSLGFGAVLPSLSKTSPKLGDLYVVIGVCFALLGAGSALDGLLRYRQFAHRLNVFFAPHPGVGETFRLMVIGVAIAVLGVATVLIVAIDRFG
jgi:uncharacterized membrane protein YidH (DUF202 family)